MGGTKAESSSNPMRDRSQEKFLGINICEGRFEFGKKIGAGSFGSVYYGFDTKEKQEVAIKIESCSSKTPQLEYEARLYKVLGSGRGLSQMYWYGQESGCNIMVLDLLGPSLQDLFNFVGRSFTLKTVFQLGHQVLDILEYMHGFGFIHRDLKPANFLVGRGDSSTQVHIIDFGLSKRYLKSGSHIPWRQKKSRGIIGSARYASVNAHQGIELSRRDDLESLGYMLIYFLRGHLPWQYIDPVPETKEQKNVQIGEQKSETKIECMCEGLPAAFAAMLVAIRCLEFEDDPPYQLYHRFLRFSEASEGINCDGQFDWTQRREDGEVVEFADEDDRLSCNLSQVSMDSTGDTNALRAIGFRGSWTDVQTASAMSAVTDPSARGSSSGSGVRASAKATSASNVQVGPLLRLSKKGGRPSDDTSSAAVMKAMQSAGYGDGQFWQNMKKLVGSEPADEQGDDKPRSDPGTG